MRKFLLLLVLTMTCQKVYDGSKPWFNIYRCENLEVVCYTSTGHSHPLVCKFKSDNVKKSQNEEVK